MGSIAASTVALGSGPSDSSLLALQNASLLQSALESLAKTTPSPSPLLLDPNSLAPSPRPLPHFLTSRMPGTAGTPSPAAAALRGNAVLQRHRLQQNAATLASLRAASPVLASAANPAALMNPYAAICSMGGVGSILNRPQAIPGATGFQATLSANPLAYYDPLIFAAAAQSAAAAAVLGSSSQPQHQQQQAALAMAAAINGYPAPSSSPGASKLPSASTPTSLPSSPSAPNPSSFLSNQQASYATLSANPNAAAAARAAYANLAAVQAQAQAQPVSSASAAAAASNAVAVAQAQQVAAAQQAAAIAQAAQAQVPSAASLAAAGYPAAALGTPYNPADPSSFLPSVSSSGGIGPMAGYQALYRNAYSRFAPY
ncbi:unnamed protein product [Cyprideis torosa]|uniref:Uncharacterized protein n=1 Tax=Cyprideis torosa TaxID=163714 RepID=A0A7R8W1L7_9CRUS|nr:unnamed protein product [Cyprideis torosa]CAG0881043.1 unnamed protein product [Cyprideis torosa]